VEQMERKISVSIKINYTFKILTMKSKLICLCTPADDMDFSKLAFELEADAISYCKRNNDFEKGDYGWNHIQLYPDLEKNSKVVDKLDQAHSARIEKMVWIAAQTETSELSDMIDQLDEEDWNFYFPEIFKSEHFDIEDSVEEKKIALFDEQKFGFLAIVNYPYLSNFRFDKNGEFKSCSVNPGHCRVVCHYAESTDELIQQIEGRAELMFKEFVKDWEREKMEE